MPFQPYEMNDLERLTTEFVESLLDSGTIDWDNDEQSPGVHFASQSNSYRARVRRFVADFTERIRETQGA